MKKIFVSLCYVITFIAAGLYLDPPAEIYINAAVTFIFIFTLVFVVFASGSNVATIFIVLILTVLFPLAILFLIGSPVYSSWLETFTAIVSASRDGGIFGGFEWFIYVLSAFVGLVLAGQIRSNKSSMDFSVK